MENMKKFSDNKPCVIHLPSELFFIAHQSNKAYMALKELQQNLKKFMNNEAEFSELLESVIQLAQEVFEIVDHGVLIEVFTEGLQKYGFLNYYATTNNVSEMLFKLLNAMFRHAYRLSEYRESTEYSIAKVLANALMIIHLMQNCLKSDEEEFRSLLRHFVVVASRGADAGTSEGTNKE